MLAHDHACVNSDHADGSTNGSADSACSADRRAGIVAYCGSEAARRARSSSPRPRGRGGCSAGARGGGARSPRAASAPRSSAEIDDLLRRLDDLDEATTNNAALRDRVDALQEELDNRNGAVQQMQTQLDDALAAGGVGAGDDAVDRGESEVVVTNTTPPPTRERIDMLIEAIVTITARGVVGAVSTARLEVLRSGFAKGAAVLRRHYTACRSLFRISTNYAMMTDFINEDLNEWAAQLQEKSTIFVSRHRVPPSADAFPEVEVPSWTHLTQFIGAGGFRN
eukprot:g11148.t1